LIKSDPKCSDVQNKTTATTTTTTTSPRVDPNLKERKFLSFAAFTTSVAAASADRTKVICFAGGNPIKETLA
jgi:hypothetical protein